MSEKLHKVIASTGSMSRREAERYIAAGKVKVNGQVATLGQRVTAQDRIQVEDKWLQVPAAEQFKRRILLYHKPVGEICTRQDPEGRPTVYANLPKLAQGRWIAVGRLDINTSGLLLFTNDGAYANQLMHPSANIERVYAVRVFGEASNQQLSHLLQGVTLEDGPAKFTRILYQGGKGKNHWYHVALMEGRKREVRRLWESQGISVSRLIRIAYGKHSLPRDLRPGQYIELS
jgi:23S rRNA pseudouridine2605 synthase